jgi:4-hydroxyphenylpyruvate dioxygenase
MIGNSIDSQLIQPTQPKLIGIDHIHFYVQDAGKWRQWFGDCLDFKPIATIGHQMQTEILQHSSIQVWLSAPNQCSNDDPVGDFLKLHPPGIAEIAFQIAASTHLPPQPTNSATDTKFEQLASLNTTKFKAWGDVTYRLIEASQKPPSLLKSPQSQKASLFTGIDHIVSNVPSGQMWEAAKWHEHHLGLQISDHFNIATDRSALRSVVLENSDRSVQMPINEPSTQNSQIQEFLDHNRGAGIQHIAFHTNDIFATVAKLKQKGVKFLATEPEILVDVQDHDKGQALLQIFTQPIFDQPTFFFEIIQRQKQAQGFGEGNFQALFEAIEHQQARRSSL